MNYKIIYVLVFFSVSLSIVDCIVCTEDFCSDVICKNETCEPGQILQPGGACSCCDVCHTILNEGDACDLLNIRKPEPDKLVCGENLVCYQNKCQKEKDVVSEIAAYNNE